MARWICGYLAEHGDEWQPIHCDALKEWVLAKKEVYSGVMFQPFATLDGSVQMLVTALEQLQRLRPPFLCTAENPAPPELRVSKPRRRVMHSDTEEVGDQRDGWPSGDLQDVRCKHCGYTWTMELPQ